MLMTRSQSLPHNSPPGIDRNLDINGVYPALAGHNALEYELAGIICFYRDQYLAYFHVPATGTWVLCDDAHLRSFASFKAVRSTIIDGMQQPSVVFYTSKEARPVAGFTSACWSPLIVTPYKIV